MKNTPKNIQAAFSAVLALAIGATSQVVAQVSTPIVGFERAPLPANSLYAWGSSLLTAPVYTAQIASVGADSITFAGSANIGSLLASSEPYYLEVKNGNAEGSRLDLVTADTIALSSNTVKISTTSVNNTDALSALAADLSGATAVIRKHNTVKDIGDRITNLTAGPSGTGDEMLIYRKDQSTFVTYLRRTSTTWRDANNGNVNSRIIPPGDGVIIRKRAVAGEILTSGLVRDNKFQLTTVAGTQLISTGFPMNYSFNDLGATNSASAWTSGVDGDRILVLSSSGTFVTYLYRTATSWRDANNANVTSSDILKSGESYILVKNQPGDYLFTPPN